MPVSAVMREDPGSWMQRLSLALHPSCEALQTPSLAVRVAGGQDQEHYWAWRWRVASFIYSPPHFDVKPSTSWNLEKEPQSHPIGKYGQNTLTSNVTMHYA